VEFGVTAGGTRLELAGRVGRTSGRLVRVQRAVARLVRRRRGLGVIDQSAVVTMTPS